MTLNHSKSVKIGITLGDPAGIGPEVVQAAIHTVPWPKEFEFVLYGKDFQAIPGKPSAEGALHAWNSLKQAASDLKNGVIDAVATAPVSKENLQSVGFPWPGQTEFFAHELGVTNYAMCLTGPTLTVGLVTIHVPLSQVPSLISEEENLRVAHLMIEFLRKKGIEKPKLAVAGLNPHAGENGAFGHEDMTFIKPAVEKLKAYYQDRATITGPLPPDTLFYHAVRGHYDAVLCQYHDQGLIPLKLLDFDSAVNITLGLPRVRTSPDHGTAFDLAGKKIASPQSMISAIQLAIQLAK